MTGGIRRSGSSGRAQSPERHGGRPADSKEKVCRLTETEPSRPFLSPPATLLPGEGRPGTSESGDLRSVERWGAPPPRGGGERCSAYKACGGFTGATDEQRRCPREGGSGPHPRPFLNCRIPGPGGPAGLEVQWRGKGEDNRILCPFYTPHRVAA